ncbi:hypothetical protein [Sphingobium sp. EM0848]|uniref:hypothetical protein n=1 Tax=Sphingobium sp. EM0848 TaxID=2743473 RepID=UPI00159C6812|nr:hypothetical protein [Sphingobium sp. EM0848]
MAALALCFGGTPIHEIQGPFGAVFQMIDVGREIRLSAPTLTKNIFKSNFEGANPIVSRSEKFLESQFLIAAHIDDLRESIMRINQPKLLLFSLNWGLDRYAPENRGHFSGRCLPRIFDRYGYIPKHCVIAGAIYAKIGAQFMPISFQSHAIRFAGGFGSPFGGLQGPDGFAFRIPGLPPRLKVEPQGYTKANDSKKAENHLPPGPAGGPFSGLCRAPLVTQLRLIAPGYILAWLAVFRGPRSLCERKGWEAALYFLWAFAVFGITVWTIDPYTCSIDSGPYCQNN